MSQKCKTELTVTNSDMDLMIFSALELNLCQIYDFPEK